MKKLRIGLDFDDVLVASAEHTIKLHNAQYGTQVTLNDWYDSSSVAPWNVEAFSDVVQRVVDVQSGEAFMEVPPLKGAQDVLTRLKAEGHELLVITGRPAQLEPQTRALLDKYYKGIFGHNDLRFADHFAHEGKRIHKGDIAVELQLTHFVDDVIQHAESVDSKGIKTVLFGKDYHWNQGEVGKSIVRIENWHELGEFFKREAA